MREEPKRLTCDVIEGMTGRDILLQLREYLIAYRVFASGTTSTGLDRGQHNPYGFSVKFGLCFNLGKYIGGVADGLTPGLQLEALMGAALEEQFNTWLAYNPQTGDDVFDFAYPFGENDFCARHDNGTQHECPKRLAFLDSAIAVLLV